MINFSFLVNIPCTSLSLSPPLCTHACMHTQIAPELMATYSLSATYSRAIDGASDFMTDLEVKLRDLWAHILHIEAENIGRQDQFLQIGGDSISAIQLVAMAQENDIGLSVASIFADSSLSHMASVATVSNTVVSYDSEPFSMLPQGSIEAIFDAVDASPTLPDMQMIEDSYPCTPLQGGLMSLSARQPGSYIGKFIYRLSANTDIDRFKSSWQRTVELCDHLRSHYLQSSSHKWPFHSRLRRCFSWLPYPHPHKLQSRKCKQRR